LAHRPRNPDELDDRPVPDGPRSGRHSAPVHFPDELVEAIAAALEAEARESDIAARAELLRRTRGVLDAWMDGAMTTPQVVETLRVARPDGGGGR
jgi:hypothetical protein